MTKIEEVARAIAAADDSHDVALWREFLPEARAAIEALRVVPDSVLGIHDLMDVEVARRIRADWARTIDAALNEKD